MHKNLKTFISLYLVLISVASARIYRPLENLDVLYKKEILGKTPADIKALSLKEYQDFLDIDVNSYERNPNYNTDSTKPTSINVEQANKTLNAVTSNPVVALHMYSKYDPTNAGIGFCFGRAMFVDLYLTINNLNRGSIKKAFVVGPMTNGGTTTWGWHVTTIVQAFDGPVEKWLAIDPIMYRVLEVKDWYAEALKMSTNGKLRMYITDAGKFAQTATRYNEQSINIKFYNSYFTDMMKWFESNDIGQELGL
ncbi:MAG TPA: hypothetical protein VNJ08_05995 [Bacteriovoracaceae bacterium]|nr:hypothetical protein [Bacteriovoracaceae bacterium]